MSTRKNRRFTLIELLMVIAIIAILASLLLPALRKGRNLAKGIECLGRKKQIGIATQQYLADNNDTYYSMFLGGSTYSWEPGGTNTWTYYLRDYLGLSQVTNIIPYYGQGKIFGCPSVSDAGGFPYCPIGYHPKMFGYSWTWQGKKQSQFRHPAQQLTHGETCYGHDSLLNHGRGTSEVSPDRMAYRHSRRCSTIFVDGHVSPEPPERLNTKDMTMPPFDTTGGVTPVIKKYSYGYAGWDD